jgi:hypothetical protein
MKYASFYFSSFPKARIISPFPTLLGLPVHRFSVFCSGKESEQGLSQSAKGDVDLGCLTVSLANIQ